MVTTVLVTRHCFFSVAVSDTILSTHFVHSQRGNQAELARVAGLNIKILYLPNGHPFQCYRVTTSLPLNQSASGCRMQKFL